MKRLLILLFSITAMSLAANADMLDPSSPTSMTNPYNPVSPYNRYNPISPYYLGDDETENDKPDTTNDKKGKGIAIIVGEETEIQKIKQYANCRKYEGGNACINILK